MTVATSAPAIETAGLGKSFGGTVALDGKTTTVHISTALREIMAGPLLVGPMFALTIALSEMSLFGLGPFFWSLILGTLVSRIFERDGWDKLRVSTTPAGQGSPAAVAPRLGRAPHERDTGDPPEA